MAIRGGKAYRQNIKVKQFVLARDSYTCQSCGCKIGDVCEKHAASVSQMDVAHKIAWDHSPASSTPDNLHALCHPCNCLERQASVTTASRTRAVWEAEVRAWA